MTARTHWRVENVFSWGVTGHNAFHQRLSMQVVARRDLADGRTWVVVNGASNVTMDVDTAASLAAALQGAVDRVREVEATADQEARTPPPRRVPHDPPEVQAPKPATTIREGHRLLRCAGLAAVRRPWRFGPCPHCNGDRPILVFRDDDRSIRWRCEYCGAHGSPERMARRLAGRGGGA